MEKPCQNHMRPHCDKKQAQDGAGLYGAILLANCLYKIIHITMPHVDFSPQ